MNKAVLIILGIIVVVGVIIAAIALSGAGTNEDSVNINTSADDNQNENAANTSTPETGSGYSLDDVAQHSSESDCWLAIEGSVYDVTEFIPEHPGGERIVQGCGKDATDLFTGKSAMGRMHSAVARRMLAQYKIGALE